MLNEHYTLASCPSLFTRRPLDLCPPVSHSHFAWGRQVGSWRLLSFSPNPHHTRRKGAGLQTPCVRATSQREAEARGGGLSSPGPPGSEPALRAPAPLGHPGHCPGAPETRASSQSRPSPPLSHPPVLTHTGLCPWPLRATQFLLRAGDQLRCQLREGQQLSGLLGLEEAGARRGSRSCPHDPPQALCPHLQRSAPASAHGSSWFPRRPGQTCRIWPGWGGIGQSCPAGT